MGRLHVIWVFGLIFGLLALGSADELDSFINNNVLPLSSDGLSEVNINRLIDDNNELIQDVLKKFDPAKLPDIPLWTKGQLTDGWLSLFSTLKRTGNSSLKYADKILSVDIKIGWEVLKYDFDYAFKLWFIPRHGKVHGSVDKISVNLKLYIDFRNYAIALEEFKFGNVGKLGLELEGTFGDKIRSWFGRIIINLAKKHIMHGVERIASKTIQEQIDVVNEQIPNHKRRFTYIDLVELNRNKYVIDENVEDNY